MTTWRPAPAIVGWLGAGVVLVALGILARRPDVVAVGVPLLLGAAWSTAGRTSRLPTVRLWGDDQPSGTGGSVTAEVRLEPAEQATLVAIRVRAPGHHPAEALVAVLAADSAARPADSGVLPANSAGVRTTAESVRVPVTMRTVRTGRRELFGLDHRTASTDGLHSTATRSEVPLPMTILPKARSLEDLPLPFRLQGLTGPHTSRRAGSGGDLHDVAPFTPGDRLRRIDWRVTARLNTAPAVLGAGPAGHPERTISRLYVRRTFATADATVMLVIDSRDQVGPRVSTWGDASSLREDESTSLDVARHAATSLAGAYLAGGDRVGLEDLGKLRRPAPPAGGRRQLLLLTQQLALSEPEGEPTRRERLPRLPSGALIVLFSTFLDGDAAAMARTWRRAGHRVLAIDTLPRLLVSGIPERLHTAYRIVAMERADRIRQLAAVGVETFAWMDHGLDPALELSSLSRLRGRR